MKVLIEVHVVEEIKLVKLLWQPTGRKTSKIEEDYTQ